MVGSFIASTIRNAAAPNHSAETVAIAAPWSPMPERSLKRPQACRRVRGTQQNVRVDNPWTTMIIQIYQNQKQQEKDKQHCRHHLGVMAASMCQRYSVVPQNNLNMGTHADDMLCLKTKATW